MHLTRLWRVMHPEIRFMYWPKVMHDVNPFEKIWSHMNNRSEHRLPNIMEVYATWEYTRADFDNFHRMYESMNIRLQRIIESAGEY